MKMRDGNEFTIQFSTGSGLLRQVSRLQDRLR